MLRPPGQLVHYSHAVELCHSIIVRAMSNEVIVPGVTTCADVSWWMWQTAVDLGFECWFQPSFGVQRAGIAGVNIYAGTLDGDTVIERGDFLWTDYGINYAGMHTDMQVRAFQHQHLVYWLCASLLDIGTTTVCTLCVRVCSTWGTCFTRARAPHQRAFRLDCRRAIGCRT